MVIGLKRYNKTKKQTKDFIEEEWGKRCPDKFTPEKDEPECIICSIWDAFDKIFSVNTLEDIQKPKMRELWNNREDEEWNKE